MRFNNRRYSPYQAMQPDPYESSIGMPMDIAMQIPQQQMQESFNSRYEFVDTIESYGSIIKDLTDTDKMLEAFELRLTGKKKMPDGSISMDIKQKVYIHDEKVAREFVDIVRSVVNRHTDFSYYDEKEALDYIKGSIALICRWLMIQGERVPLHYRYKLSFEALAFITASIHKATNGRMLVYTKGSFNVNESNAERNQNQKKGILSYIFPFLNKRR